MALYMKTTKIPAERTAQEICALLVAAGATNIHQHYENKKLISLRWTMRVREQEIPFSMPARVEPVMRLLQQRRSTRFRSRLEEADRAQAERVAWRQVLRWVQAQIAMIDTGMVEATEVFMAYIEVAPNQTMYAALTEGQFKALTAGAR